MSVSPVTPYDYTARESCLLKSYFTYCISRFIVTNSSLTVNQPTKSNMWLSEHLGTKRHRSGLHSANGDDRENVNHGLYKIEPMQN